MTLDSSAPAGSSAGALYVVATPIGNLEDITLRALRTLKECDLIACEDTRTTLKLLSRYDIHRPVTSYHQHSGGKKAGDLLAEIGRGKNVALVSEAGMPGISDPGHELIAACIAAGIQVIPIPGACALITLLPVSGLNTSAFVFQGFPPRKPGERARFFEGLRQETRTLLFYESPNRVRATLEAMLDAWGDRPVALGRELTKLHEEVWRGGLGEAVAEFTERRPRGEFVIAVAGAAQQAENVGDIEKEYLSLVSNGLDDKAAIAVLVKSSGLTRRQVYALVLQWKGKR